MHSLFHLETFNTNGIRMRAAVAGSGPLIVMVHGWPELWYSWRHQIGPLAKAGYKVAAIDVRGYGGSDKPYEIRAYDMQTMMADIIGVIDHFGADQAILIGHDWGAPICWNTAALFPERVSTVSGLSVPYRKRATISFPALWEIFYKDRFFYQRYFQKEGVAEAELERDVGVSLRKFYYAISGDAPNMDHWKNRDLDGGLLEGMPDPDPFPDWLTKDDLDYLTTEFTAGGFRGPLNRYRNQTVDFDELPQMGVPPIHQPSCFIAGSDDLVRNLIPGHDGYVDPSENCTDMRVCKIIAGKGHWIQQEAPDRVTDALLGFLRNLRN